MPLTKDAPMTHYRHAVIDGQRIFYREAGDRSRPTLLLLHGFPASSFMYRKLLEDLADEFHLIAPDYPGFGYSDAPTPADFNYTFDHLALVMEALLDHLDIDRFGLYMQDFGGPVGFRLAHRHPQRVRFLVIQNANAYEEGLPDGFWAPARALWAEPSPANWSRIREAAMSDAALSWNYTHGVRDTDRVSPDSWMLQKLLLERPGNKEVMLALLYDYRSNLAQYPLWQAYLREHQPPTLVVWGRHDVIFPEAGAYPYQRDLRDLDFHLLDTGHFALDDQGDAIVGLMRRFAARHLA